MLYYFKGNTLWFCGHGNPRRRGPAVFEENSQKEGGGDGHGSYFVLFWSRLPNQG